MKKKGAFVIFLKELFRKCQQNLNFRKEKSITDHYKPGLDQFGEKKKLYQFKIKNNTEV